MMKKILLWSVLLFSILLAACGRMAATSQPLPSPKPFPTQQQVFGLTGTWTVDMQLSGGFAGLSRSIQISSDGTVVAKDERNGKTVKRQLTSGELTQFITLAKSASLRPTSGTPTGCADCFIYNIKITSTGGNFFAQFDDVNLPNSGMSSVVKFLMDLMSNMLANG